MSKTKRMWVKSRELKGVRDLLRNRFGDGSNDKTVVPFDEILPLLVKPEPTRLVWTRAFRRFLRHELGVRCGLRETKQHFIFQIIDPEKWRRSLEGHTRLVSQPTFTALTLPPRSDDPLIPEPDPHYQFPPYTEDLIKALESDERVLLVGPTGCGKTSLVREISSRRSQRFLRVNLNGETSVADIVGQFKIDAERNMVFNEGPVPRALRCGAWLCIDELDSALPAVLFALHPLLEAGGGMTISETGEHIPPHPDFRLVATANTLGRGDETGLYAGTNVLNEAFLDRFHSVFHVDYMDPSGERDLLCKKTDGLKRDLAERMVRAAGDIRRAAADGTIYTTFSTRRLLAWASKCLQLGDAKRAALYTVLNRLSDDDRRVVAEVLQRHGFGGGAS